MRINVSKLTFQELEDLVVFYEKNNKDVELVNTELRISEVKEWKEQ